MSNGDQAATAVPFVLPGPPADRETAAGWAQWRLTRHRFAPAPRLPLEDYRRLNPRKRMLHDLHRAATHANLAIQETPRRERKPDPDPPRRRLAAALAPPARLRLHHPPAAAR